MCGWFSVAVAQLLRSTGREFVRPFGKVHLSLSTLGLICSSQLLHKEDTVQTSHRVKEALYLEA